MRARLQDDVADKLTDRYNREARAYRDLWAPILRSAGLALLRELAGPRVQRLVDVGTGVGALLRDEVTTFPGALVLGVDRAPGMLALAPAGIPCAVMDARQLAIGSGRVDLVLLTFILFHLDDPSDGLREARRVLRDGGRVATLTWGGDLESKASRIWTEYLDAHGAVPPDPAAAMRHDLVDTPGKIEMLLDVSGFNSPRSWMGDVVSNVDLEHLLRLRTSRGAEKARFESLDHESQEACVAAARRRMEGLAPEDFTVRGQVVFGVAST